MPSAGVAMSLLAPKFTIHALPSGTYAVAGRQVRLWAFTSSRSLCASTSKHEGAGVQLHDSIFFANGTAGRTMAPMRQIAPDMCSTAYMSGALLWF